MITMKSRVRDIYAHPVGRDIVDKVLIAALHARGMRIIMDLVVNHSSDEHPFFVEAMQNPDSPKREYYFFREGKDGGPSNNWKSFFSGPAWKKMPDGTYAMHLFSSKQMDFNWDCPALREEVADIVRWWFERGAMDSSRHAL